MGKCVGVLGRCRGCESFLSLLSTLFHTSPTLFLPPPTPLHTFPYTSLTFPTLQHTSLHLSSHLPRTSPHPNAFPLFSLHTSRLLSYSPHTSPNSPNYQKFPNSPTIHTVPYSPPVLLHSYSYYLFTPYQNLSSNQAGALTTPRKFLKTKIKVLIFVPDTEHREWFHC